MDPPLRLSTWPHVVVRVDCKLCTRRGCYRLARLAHHFGPEMDLEGVLNHLAADCPWNRKGRPARPYEARCGIRLTDWDRPRMAPPETSRRNIPSDPVRVPILGDLQAETIAIACVRCRRRGVYRVARLKARLGPDMPCGVWLSQVSAGCPGRRETVPRCGARFERSEW